MNIAIIEESKSISHILSRTLRSYGYVTKVVTSKSIEETLSELTVYKFFLISSKFTKPNIYELIRYIRENNPKAYCLAISDKQNWRERVSYLRAGADDVLDYPFALQELLARIQALLRRPVRSRRRVYRFANLSLDPGNRLLKVEEKKVKLSSKEFTLLEYMIKNKERPISRSELLDNVWDYSKLNLSNTVDVHISRLRKLLKGPPYLKSVHGYGYLLTKEEPDVNKDSYMEDSIIKPLT